MKEEIWHVRCDHYGCPRYTLIVNDHHPPAWWISREVQFCPEHRPGLIGNKHQAHDPPPISPSVVRPPK